MNNIKEKIKNSIIGKIFYRIRDFYRFPNEISFWGKINKTEDYAILLGVPTYNNLGDHLIAESSKLLINKIYPEKKIIEIPTRFFVKNKEKLKERVDLNVPIFIVGGGWMGSVWPEDEYRMQDMIKTFNKNTIVILPQTVFYDLDNEKARKILKDAKEVYKMCDDLIMFYRDQNSYNFAKENFNFSNVKIFLAPDIALVYPNIKDENKHNTIILCLRKDREKNRKINIEDIITKYAKIRKYKIYKTDTVSKYSIPIWYRKTCIKKKIKEFSTSELVITDRLHGMIFSVLAGTKCIAFDNVTKKVSGVYKLWLSKNNNIKLVNENISEEEFILLVKEIINKNFDLIKWKIEIDVLFSQMKYNIKNMEE